MHGTGVFLYPIPFHSGYCLQAVPVPKKLRRGPISHEFKLLTLYFRWGDLKSSMALYSCVTAAGGCSITAMPLPYPSRNSDLTL